MLKPLIGSFHTSRRHRVMQRSLLLAGTLAAACGLGACSLQWQNPQPARELARLSKPPGSVYAGWRVFQDKCAACHGPDATGGSGAPDLLPRVRPMGPREFVGVVLSRYDWGLTGPREALVDEVVQRRQGQLTMRAWAGEPEVNAHIADLHAYLSARAQGTQGAGRPAR